MRQYLQLIKQNYNLCLVRLISSEDLFQICQKGTPSFVEVEIDQEFKWGDVQQKVFEEIKEYMKFPPVLVPPQQGKPFKLYVLANSQTIGSALMQEFEGKERVVFYLSRRLLDPEIRYSPIEKVMLMLIFLLH